MAFDLRMRALHCAQQSGNSASNPEQAIRFIPTHFADSERHCSAAANQDGDETDEKNNPEGALAAMLALPAFAQSYNAGYGGGSIINLPALEHGGPTASGSEAFASV